MTIPTERSAPPALAGSFTLGVTTRSRTTRSPSRSRDRLDPNQALLRTLPKEPAREGELAKGAIMGVTQSRLRRALFIIRPCYYDCPMTLPVDLIEAVRSAATSQGMDDPDGIIDRVRQMAANDECRKWTVWTGPAWSQDNLLLDVYILGDWGLHNYAAFSEGVVVESSVFLDVIETVAVAKTNDPRSPYLLILHRGGQESGRMFGTAEQLPELDSFRAALGARIMEMRRKE